MQRHVEAVPEGDRREIGGSVTRFTCWTGFTSCKSSAKAMDEIRAEEAKRLERDGYEPVLKRSGGVC